jgi:polyphenol oxidase
MQNQSIIQVPEWSQLAFLHHGFGTRLLSEEQLIKQASGFAFIFLNQIHSDTIVRLDAIPETPLNADACITAEPGFMLVIQTADCLPVLFLDFNRKVIGAGHCGWKGTALGLAPKIVSAMEDEFKCAKENIIAALGPCIGLFHYQVGEDVRQIFRQNGRGEAGFYSSGNKLYFDLKNANREQLLGAGIKKIIQIDACTHSESVFYSYRRDGALTGRMLNFIGLRKPSF